MKRNFLFIILISSILYSCFKEDDRITPHQRNEIVLPVSMYYNQLYFSLDSGKFISINKITDWDLGFESSDNGWHIILNYSKFMKTVNTQKTDFNSITSVKGLTFDIDRSNGSLDSTAIGKWADFSKQTPVFYKNVYVIDRGFNEKGDSIGYKKVIFEKLENNMYFIKYADLNGNNLISTTIIKNTEQDFTQFSFDNGVFNSNVKKKNWDLLFTQYSTLLYDGANWIPYSVRGIYTNRNTIESALDTINNFTQVTADKIPTYKFSKNQDAIGYDWKDYNNGVYTVLPKRVYIIKGVSGNYYKLIFTTFANSKGEYGFPKFEYVKLK